MTKGDIKGVLFTAAAVILAGLALKFGKKLPVLKDAADGFGA